jgi:hypothetical protein
LAVLDRLTPLSFWAFFIVPGESSQGEVTALIRGAREPLRIPEKALNRATLAMTRLGRALTILEVTDNTHDSAT